jgi:hypothetical protein
MEKVQTKEVTIQKISSVRETIDSLNGFKVDILGTTYVSNSMNEATETILSISPFENEYTGELKARLTVGKTDEEIIQMVDEYLNIKADLESFKDSNTQWLWFDSFQSMLDALNTLDTTNLKESRLQTLRELKAVYENILRVYTNLDGVIQDLDSLIHSIQKAV